MVVNHENIFIPVGTAIIMVVKLKYALVSTSRPTVYMWWAHTTYPIKPIPNIAQTIPLWPKTSSFLAKYLVTSLIIPKVGSMRT